MNIDNRLIQKDLRKDWLLEIENERRQGNGLNIFGSYEELKDFNDNDSNGDLIDLKNDFELIESTKIINDYLNLNKKTMLSSVK